MGYYASAYPIGTVTLKFNLTAILVSKCHFCYKCVCVCVCVCVHLKLRHTIHKYILLKFNLLNNILLFVE